MKKGKCSPCDQATKGIKTAMSNLNITEMKSHLTTICKTAKKRGSSFLGTCDIPIPIPRSVCATCRWLKLIKHTNQGNLYNITNVSLFEIPCYF